MVTSCRILMDSSFPSKVDLDLLDSTQISNPPPNLGVRLARAAARFANFIVRVERRRPDAVLLFVAVGASIVEKGAMAWYARLRNVPVIMFPRGGSVIDDCKTSRFTRRWVRLAFRGAQKIICQSESWRSFAVEVLGFMRSHVVVIRNWTATRDLLDLGAQRVRRGDSPVRLLFLGWLDREKGIFELIEACRRLSNHANFTLDIAGEGDASAEIRTLVERHQLSHIVRFHGWIRGEALRATLRDADALVLPSWAEGLPNAMIEAMAAGLAVVVTRVGAIPELITDHRSGLLVEPRNVESLAAALGEIIDNPDLRASLGAQAYRIATQDFEVESAVERLMGEIESTVAAGRERRLSGQAS
jgi:glycosyltransferase involved in cell wall biosynthesis